MEMNKENKNIKNIVAIVIIAIIVLIVSIILATKDDYSSDKQCLYTPAETEKKLIEIAEKRDDNSYYYKENHVTLYNNNISIYMNKDKYDEKILYDFISLFVDIDEDSFTKIINNSLKYNETYERRGSIHINTDKYSMYISVSNTSVYVSLDLCVHSYDTPGYSTDILDENNIKEYDLWVLKEFFNIDFKYSDLIVYLNKESIDNSGEALLEIDDLYKTRIILRGDNIYYSNNYNYLYRKLIYGVTHSILDYKDKLETDFTYLKTYFNYEYDEYKSKIINIIESGEYKNKGDYIKNGYNGNYYDYYMILDNNCEIELRVYDDKIYFEFGFRE